MQGKYPVYINYIFFFLSVSFPPNTEGSAELCEAIGACLRTQDRIFNPTPEHNSLLPSFLSGGQIRNDDRRKNII